MSNRLKNEISPYLLQYAENPVDWFPWGNEAFEKAKSEDKPIFLSIGYSTCHWCHVMAHESFESEEIAGILNRDFVSIKVDREQRPDIDSVYMSVCQALTGSGGWPMSIFMSADKKPFFAGTYFPPHSRYGSSGFADILSAIAKLWRTDREKLIRSADVIINETKEQNAGQADVEPHDLPEKAVRLLSYSFDKVNGGFGSAPKFPTPHNLLFLMLYAVQNDRTDIQQMAEKALLQMHKGGIFDHIGGGFSRYSTDKYFLVPHFEKMLYDNALLIMAYSTAYHLTENEIYLDTARKTADYILREMTAPDGGFYSAQDADSDGVEGKYYTFTYDEIIRVLGRERGERFAGVFDITENGNFEGTNIPNLLKSSDFQTDFSEEIGRLYAYRKQRTHLHLDDKILLSWNSLMIAALCMLYRACGDNRYLNAAEKAQKFIADNMTDGLQLFSSCRDGKRSESAFLDDYAFYIAALIELYHSTLKADYLRTASVLCDEAEKRFADNNGGYCLCESTELFMNPKETYDGAVPSGNSVMVYDFVRLYHITDDSRYRTLAEKQIGYLSSRIAGLPMGNCLFLIAKLLYDSPPTHITVAAKSDNELNELRERLPFFADISVRINSREYPLKNSRTTYYICKGRECLPPRNDL